MGMVPTCDVLVLADRAGMFEYPIRREAEQSRKNREHPVVFGQERVKMDTRQSYMANNIPCGLCILVHPFLA